MKEVTINIIRDGVISALSQRFPNIKRYGEEIKQGFTEPCFFVKLLPVEHTRELGRRFRRYHTFDIHYFPDGDRKVNTAHDMAEKLYDLFRFITINQDQYMITGTNHEVTDGVLHFFFDINFMVWEEAPDDPKMRTLAQEGWLK
ncbi:hypothetical protein BK129_14870 [Paenibacillus amylolyticus]|uniref:phage tail terminator family protein n=1 Tax=Paenibacillus amylolyticus TaxID=1451 RepID=UPI00096C12AA|nr:hypothetical protein [Paenibacillus amylolyticus]OMF05266.1 hypothetical protein BK129_14870 [Paenibacillus amylolyticus]